MNQPVPPPEPATEPPPGLEPAHGLRRAVICTRWATAALACIVAAQAAAAAAAAVVGSPAAAALPFLIFGAVTLGVVAIGAFIATTVLARDPAVQLAFAEVERAEEDMQLQQITASRVRMDAALRSQGLVPAGERQSRQSAGAR